MQFKCPRNELHIFSISKAWNELHKPRKKRKTSPKPLAPMDGQGNQRSSQMWWRNEQELPSPEPRTVRTSELNGSGGRRGKGISGLSNFVPVGDINRDKRRTFYPGCWLQPGQKAARAFCPGWWLHPRLKETFYPGWSLHPGQKVRPALVISTAHLISLVSLFLFSLQISPPASSPRSIPFLPPSPSLP